MEQNLTGKPVCVLSTRHWEMNSPFSRTNKAKAIYTRVAYQEAIECSCVVKLQF
jgi:hypothetical protein